MKTNIWKDKLLLFLLVFLAAVSLYAYRMSSAEPPDYFDYVDTSLAWSSFSYSDPVLMAVWADIDSTTWVIDDPGTLAWFSENFNNFEISYKPVRSPTRGTSLTIWIACENGDGYALDVNEHNELTIPEGSRVNGETLKTIPPTGVYAIDSAFDFEELWEISRARETPAGPAEG